LLGKERHLGFIISQGLHGIEREALRVDTNGRLALTPHPRVLGSALTHPQITTDYSESLLELITPARNDISAVFNELEAAHRFVYNKIDNELLWNQSMPAYLPTEEKIPIAYYGVSHIGTLKSIYRRGLALRYGKRMQCIAGIHYNYSLSEDFWGALKKFEGISGTTKNFQSESYIALIRNFRRYSWLLMYLFGSSPALSKCFLDDDLHRLDSFHGLEALDRETLYMPYATSLRMSDLGYASKAQASLSPQFNSLDDYIKNLSLAVSTPYPPYAKVGTHRNGERIQINTNILQIENEYYSIIRPKRVTKPGEQPIQALSMRGVQYIEVRCIDIDPFEPLGISLETSHFLDAFLLFCTFHDSPLISTEENIENAENFSLVVKEGRRPGLKLRQKGKYVSLQTWGQQLIEKISSLVLLLDSHRNDGAYMKSLTKQALKLKFTEETPSARILATLLRNKESFGSFSLRQSKEHAAYFRAYPPSTEERTYFDKLTRVSLSEQETLEQTQSGDFDSFIELYHASTLGNIKF